MITYRVLTAAEIDRALFKGFIRHQVVTDCWRKVDGAWVVKPDPFVDDWSEADYQTLVACLKNTVETGGFVCGAFAGEECVCGASSHDSSSDGAADEVLKGFVSVEAGLFGGDRRYRGRGIGTELFSRAKKWARAAGAGKLYISAHSAVESQAFYRAMGCVEAQVYNERHVAAEPFDCQLECAL